MDDATYESRRLSQKDPGLDPTRHMIKKLRIRHITYELRMGPHRHTWVLCCRDSIHLCWHTTSIDVLYHSPRSMIFRRCLIHRVCTCNEAEAMIRTGGDRRMLLNYEEDVGQRTETVRCSM